MGPSMENLSERTLAAPQQTVNMGSLQTSAAAQHYFSGHSSWLALAAQTGHSPTTQDAAVAARIADIRRVRKIEATANWWSADEADSSINGNFCLSHFRTSK